jgi:hypothetical protein
VAEGRCPAIGKPFAEAYMRGPAAFAAASLIAREVFQALLRLVQPLGGTDEPRLALYPTSVECDVPSDATR